MDDAPRFPLKSPRFHILPNAPRGHKPERERGFDDHCILVPVTRLMGEGGGGGLRLLLTTTEIVSGIFGCMAVQNPGTNISRRESKVSPSLWYPVSPPTREKFVVDGKSGSLYAGQANHRC